MKRHVDVRDTGGSPLTAQAAQLSTLLHSRTPTLGVFGLAGFPDEQSGIDSLIAYARRGASLLEVGMAMPFAHLDGPSISAAHARVVSRGYGIDTLLRTIRHTAAATDQPVVVMAYWSSVADYGPQGFARALAAAGAAGCMVADLPAADAPAWLAAAADAGIHAPLLASRQAPAAGLAAVCRSATGMIYAPAVVGQPTGYQGELDTAALARFVEDIRRLAPTTPIATGIGVHTPELAAAIVRTTAVNAVIVGSPLIRALGSGAGLRAAADLVGEFAAAISSPGPQAPDADAAFHDVPEGVGRHD